MIKIGDVAWANNRAWQYVNSKDKAAWWSWDTQFNEPSWASLNTIYCHEDFYWLVLNGKQIISDNKPPVDTIERIPE